MKIFIPVPDSVFRKSKYVIPYNYGKYSTFRLPPRGYQLEKFVRLLEFADIFEDFPAKLSLFTKTQNLTQIYPFLGLFTTKKVKIDF